MNHKPMAIDLLGKKFNRLLVVSRSHKDKFNRAVWNCKCDCGNYHKVASPNLRNGSIKSCGCLKLEQPFKHGMADTPLHNVWKGINSRCHTKSGGNYKYYGARGITICHEWTDFINFYNDMHVGYKKGLTLERIDVNGNYCKENCRWATTKEQSRNKTNSTYIELNGESKTLSEWEEISGTHRTNIQFRLKKGWSTQEAIFGRPITELSELNHYLVF